MPSDLRLEQLSRWVHKTKPDAKLVPASADASFRRYFRVIDQEQTWIAMDAPPEKENLIPFIDVGRRLVAASVNAPTIYESDLEQGFLLMDDLGSEPYLSQLNDDTADALYGDAFEALIKIQLADSNQLPLYDEALLSNELQLMPEWFLKTHLNIELLSSEKQMLADAFLFLVNSALEQPQVFVHRDYHSRNLMITDKDNPGVIDYQDAVLGPICYDLVSILRDCYISWPESRLIRWVEEYRLLAVSSDVISEDIDSSQFKRWFDLIGLQRHIKVLGIFARLSHRDGKQNYLNDLPLTLSYVLSVAKRYPETAGINELFHKYDIPQKIGMIEIPA